VRALELLVEPLALADIDQVKHAVHGHASIGSVPPHNL
jgi:hypothetical protein